jgi:hypothetical protein
MLGNYRVASQLGASQVMLSSIELVSLFVIRTANGFYPVAVLPQFEAVSRLHAIQQNFT